MLEKQLVVLRNKKKYIESILNDTIDLRKKKKEQIIEMLQHEGFDKIEEDEEYKYLLKMSMDSVSEDNITKLQVEFAKKESELLETKNKTINAMWLGELKELEGVYEEFIKERQSQCEEVDRKLTKKTKIKK
jgi:DNA topoisomerase-2